MLYNLQKPIIFAHRGASADAPENTLAAFELALQQGANAIELDVKLSADNVPVVIHDSTVDRTTDGSGAVANLSLSALKELDAGDGQKIPTLDEVFESLGGKLFINIELTNYSTRDDQLVEKVVEIVKKHNLSQGIIFSSFLPKNLKVAGKLLPEVPRGLLAQPNFLGWFMRNILFRIGDFQALHPQLNNCSKRTIENTHGIERQIYAWTINEAEDMRRVADWGIDGIFTDDVQLAVKVLR
ncbi:MAG: glycerophosphodiester phosphodiesterase [Anaerolineae bacterium]|jgi:glycerophosphoryl diester phosphodiesterase|nr:glycerophosphodiester phosphodiesterase [Anaerolineae bacterium]MBT7782770.1 glycerophosphodiester phosphodiesterase [Anaerolineae bacterium]